MAATTLLARRGSPGLIEFQSNPFRSLRVPVAATTEEAAFEAERVLTLARADMSPDAPDPLPWLPSPELPELQQAAQSLEEPLVRLRRQLLWFDFEQDPKGAALASALASLDAAAIERWLDDETPLGAVATPDGVEDGEAGEPSPDFSLVAHAINQANLRLLVVEARINAFWREGASQPPLQAIDAKAWTSQGGLRLLPDAHRIVVGRLCAVGTDSIGELWQGALSRWIALLGHSWFKSYVATRIVALDDDFADPDDAAALDESVRAHLADVTAQEVRFLIVEGRYGLARALLDAIAASGFEPRTLTPAMRPVRQVLQAELGELDPLLDHDEADGVEPIARYLHRLGGARERWLTLDELGILGLKDLVDKAVERVYSKLRDWSKPGKEADGLLAEAADIASAQSLRERIASLRNEQQERRDRVCEFCKVNEPNYEKSVVLRGKKETHRTKQALSQTVHYLIRHQLMLRCTQCAEYHDFIRSAAIALSVLTLAALAVIAIGIASMSSNASPSADSAAMEPAAASDAAEAAAAAASDATGVPDSSSDAADVSVDDLTLTHDEAVNSEPERQDMPPSGMSDTLTLEQGRYCEFMMRRIHDANTLIPDTDASAILHYNALLKDLKSRCANGSIETSDKDTVEADANTEASKLHDDAQALVNEWNQ